MRTKFPCRAGVLYSLLFLITILVSTIAQALTVVNKTAQDMKVLVSCGYMPDKFAARECTNHVIAPQKGGVVDFNIHNLQTSILYVEVSYYEINNPAKVFKCPRIFTNPRGGFSPSLTLTILSPSKGHFTCN